MNSMKVSVRVGGISVKKELVASTPTHGNTNDKATSVATTTVKLENASVGIKAEYDDATDDDEFDPKVSKPPIKTVIWLYNDTEIIIRENIDEEVDST